MHWTVFSEPWAVLIYFVKDLNIITQGKRKSIKNVEEQAILKADPVHKFSFATSLRIFFQRK